MASSYLGVDGTAHKLKSLYVGVDGVARKVKKAYIGVDGKARLWYQAGVPLSTLEVGSIVKIKWSGVSRNFIVVQQGKPSSDYDDDCSGTWLLMQDIYETGKWSSYTGMDNCLGDNILKAAMTPTLPNFSYDTKVFLLSNREVGITSTIYYYPTDGAALSYFKGASNSKRIAYYDGTATGWWLREARNEAPENTFYGYRLGISKKGAIDSLSQTSISGIRPAFILPSTVLVDDNNNVIT